MGSRSSTAPTSSVRRPREPVKPTLAPIGSQAMLSLLWRAPPSPICAAARTTWVWFLRSRRSEPTMLHTLLELMRAGRASRRRGSRAARAPLPPLLLQGSTHYGPSPGRLYPLWFGPACRGSTVGVVEGTRTPFQAGGKRCLIIAVVLYAAGRGLNNCSSMS